MGIFKKHKKAEDKLPPAQQAIVVEQGYNSGQPSSYTHSSAGVAVGGNGGVWGAPKPTVLRNANINAVDIPSGVKKVEPLVETISMPIVNPNIVSENETE